MYPDGFCFIMAFCHEETGSINPYVYAAMLLSMMTTVTLPYFVVVCTKVFIFQRFSSDMWFQFRTLLRGFLF